MKSCGYCVGLDCYREVVSEDFIFLRESSILFLFRLGHRHLIKEKSNKITGKKGKCSNSSCCEITSFHIKDGFFLFTLGFKLFLGILATGKTVYKLQSTRDFWDSV